MSVELSIVRRIPGIHKMHVSDGLGFSKEKRLSYLYGEQDPVYALQRDIPIEFGF